MKTLSNLKVKGYKSLRETDISLTSLNVFIGPNGAGKSNFIAAFELLRQIASRNLATYTLRNGGADSLLHFGSKHTSSITLSFALTDLASQRIKYRCRLIPTTEDTLVFSEEQCGIQQPSGSLQWIELGSGHSETHLYEATTASGHASIAREVLKAMLSWRVYHFHDTSTTAKIKSLGDIDDNQELREDASNLAAYLYYLQQKYPQHYQRIVSSVRLVAPFFSDFDLKPNRLNPEKIRLEWHEKDSDTYFNAHALSDGTLRFICLATLLQMPELPSTILIDEPELGLHPYAIAILAALLRSAATRSQVLVSTQSVTLINQFTAQDIIVVNRRGHQSIFARLDPDALMAWLEDYGVGDLWEKNLLGGRPQ